MYDEYLVLKINIETKIKDWYFQIGNYCHAF